MPFTDTDLDNMLTAMGAVDVVVRLQGIAIKPIKGIWRRRTEFVGQAGQIVILPSLDCKESDLSDVTRQHTFEVGGVEYKAFGDVEPRNSGFARVGLVKR